METDLVTLDNLDFDIPSEAKVFYKTTKEENPKMYGQNLLLLNQIVLVCPNWII